MCLIAFAIGQSLRFPFILINNRDEIINRPTTELYLDPVTHILCARDVNIPITPDTPGIISLEEIQKLIMKNKEEGAASPKDQDGKIGVVEASKKVSVLAGTWLGVNIDTLRLVGMTNVRRCPSTVLLTVEEQKLLAEKKKKLLLELKEKEERKGAEGESYLAPPLFEFQPDESRGLLLMRLLNTSPSEDLCESIPEVYTATNPPRPAIMPQQLTIKKEVSIEQTENEEGSSPSKKSPQYDGYNLFVGDLRDILDQCQQKEECDKKIKKKTKSSSGDCGLYYSTNRYHLERNVPLPIGFHCVSNSFLNNPNEQKCCYLRTALQKVVETVLQPNEETEELQGGNHQSQAADGKKSSEEGKEKVLSIGQVVDALSPPLCATPQFPRIDSQLVEASAGYCAACVRWSKYEEYLQRNVYTKGVNVNAPPPCEEGDKAKCDDDQRQKEEEQKHGEGGRENVVEKLIFGTRIQTIMLVEDLQWSNKNARGGGALSSPSSSEKGKNESTIVCRYRLHVYQRQTYTPEKHGEWRHVEHDFSS